MFEFKLPDLGEGIHEAEILKWHVKAGENIQEDAALVDAETDKAAVTIPSPRGGKIIKTSGNVGDIVTVGQVIVVIDDGTGPSEALDEPAAEVAGEVAPPPEKKKAPTSVVSGGRSGPVPAAPATRRLARELGVNLAEVPATGPGGRVQPEDIRSFAASEPVAQPEALPEPQSSVEGFATLSGPSAIPFFDLEPMPDFSQWGPVEKEPVRSIRRRIAKKMTTSMVVVPHVIHMDEADITPIEQFRARMRQRNPDSPSLTLLAFVLKAVAAALKKAPSFNASLDPHRQEIIYKKYINIGLAADTPRGLMVPVVAHTDQKSILDLSEEIRRLATAARDGSIGVDELRGGTFTITNIGPLGGIALAPAINYPEVAILGMGQAKEKPVVRDGEIVVRTMLPLTLAFDHRVADGADAARFVSHVVRMLQDLDQLLLEV